jgi:hypothetical protein
MMFVWQAGPESVTFITCDKWYNLTVRIARGDISLFIEGERGFSPFVYPPSSDRKAS